MTWTTVAVGAGTALAGMYGANKAAGAASSGYNSAADAQRAMYGQSRQDLMPYMNFGNNYALPGLTNFVNAGGLNMPTASTISSMPGYQFNFNQGLNALQNSAIAKGGLNSGNAMKAVMQYGQDYAGSQWKDYMNQNNQLMNQWLQLANLGQNSAAGSASNAMSSGNTLANIYANAGNTQAGYTLAPYQLAANIGGMYLGSKWNK